MGVKCADTSSGGGGNTNTADYPSSGIATFHCVLLLAKFACQPPSGRPDLPTSHVSYGSVSLDEFLIGFQLQRVAFL